MIIVVLHRYAAAGAAAASDDCDPGGGGAIVSVSATALALGSECFPPKCTPPIFGLDLPAHSCYVKLDITVQFLS